MAEQKSTKISTLLLLGGGPFVLLGIAFLVLPETMMNAISIDTIEPMLLGMVFLSIGLMDVALAAFFRSRNS